MKLLETFKHYELADSAPDYPTHKPIYKGYLAICLYLITNRVLSNETT